MTQPSGFADHLRRIGLLLVCALLCLPEGANAQGPFYTAQSPIAFNSLNSDDFVIVQFLQNKYWGFFPTQTSDWKDVGFIYHTGPLYDERAYAPIARRLAFNGYPSFIIDEPLSLAFLTPFRADLVIRDYPELKGWVVAGHGIGGAVASCYAQWRENVDGLALFSSYPFPLFNNLRTRDIEAISLWGNMDGVTSRQQWEDGQISLPSGTKFLEIDGGNHSFMAWLTLIVNGDGEGAITRDQQQDIVLKELKQLMERVNNKVNSEDQDDGGDDITEDDDEDDEYDDDKGSKFDG